MYSITPTANAGNLTPLSRKNLQTVPEEMGVYHLINGLHTVVFVGKSKNLQQDLEKHLNAESYHASYFRWFRTRSEIEADHLESVHIDKYRPIHNAPKWAITSKKA